MSSVAFFTGFENNDLSAIAPTNVHSAGGDFNWAAPAVSSTNPRSRTYHLRCSATDSGSTWGTGAYLIWSVGSNPWVAGPAVPIPAVGTAGGCDISFSYANNQVVTGGTNLMKICGIGGFGEVTIWSTNASGTRNIGISGPDNVVRYVYTGMTSGTYYDIRVKVAVDSSGNGLARCWVFTNGSDTLLGHASIPYTTTGSKAGVYIGAAPFNTNPLFCQGDQDHDFDDIIIKTGVTLSESSDNGSGAIELVKANAAGTFAENNSSGGGASAYTNVDDTPASPDDTDYNWTDKSVSAGLPDRDYFQWASYAGAGTIKAVSYFCRHQAYLGAIDGNHASGWYDGTAWNVTTLPIVGSTWTWTALIITTQRDGSALTNAYVNGLEMIMQRTSNLAGLNDKKFSNAYVELYDDTGRTPLTEAGQTATPTTAALVLATFAPTVTATTGAAVFIPRVTII